MTRPEGLPLTSEDKLVLAAQAFLKRYDELWPEVEGVFVFANVHGAKWPVGKNWAKELEALREAAF